MVVGFVPENKIHKKLYTLLLFCFTGFCCASDVAIFLAKQKAHTPFSIPLGIVLSEQDTCPICLDPLEGNCYKLPKKDGACGHVFHHMCLDEWKAQCTEDDFSCPFDRTPVERKEYRKPPITIAYLKKQGYAVIVNKDHRIIMIRPDTSVVELLRAPYPAVMQSLDGLSQVITELDLSGSNIGYIPDMRSLSTLKEVDMSHNPLGRQPQTWTHLPVSLEELRIVETGLGQMPDVRFLHLLRILDASNNQARDSFYKKSAFVVAGKKLPRSLQELSLSMCGLTDMPPDIKELNLRMLNISMNPLQNIPKDTLPQTLELLDTAGCELTTVPPDIKAMRGLKVCDISQNPLNIDQKGKKPFNTSLEVLKVRNAGNAPWLLPRELGVSDGTHILRTHDDI